MHIWGEGLSVKKAMNLLKISISKNEVENSQKISMKLNEKINYR